MVVVARSGHFADSPPKFGTAVTVCVVVGRRGGKYLPDIAVRIVEDDDEVPVGAGYREAVRASLDGKPVNGGEDAGFQTGHSLTNLSPRCRRCMLNRSLASTIITMSLSK